MASRSVSSSASRSAFADRGLRAAVEAALAEVRALYRADASPWVVGYSGGKDSTATLQLVWMALAGLAPEERVKPVHVISTDTLVENPVVAAWVARSLSAMRAAADHTGLPIVPHRLTPEVKDTFWVNLIGKGYPAPRPKLRWCTDRMKIRPSNAFIRGLTRASGEAILVLGTRKAESRVRARSMAKLEERRVRDKLSPNAGLPGSLVYTPIEGWSSDEVWIFLMSIANPWGFDNKDLLAMYQGASPDGECPLVIDTSTPSCGDSRFGCWVCTMVDEDKSMAAMIHNDEDHAWMLPLLALRNELDARDDRALRDFRRSSGLLQLHKGRLVHGPYTQGARETWLRKLLAAQRHVRERGPDHARDLKLITFAELAEIRRIWVIDKHEIEDRLPRIYAEVLGEPYPGPPIERGAIFGDEDMALLREACEGDALRFQLARELLSVERRHHAPSRRAGLHEALEKALRRGFYESEEDATRFALIAEEARAEVERTCAGKGRCKR